MRTKGIVSRLATRLSETGKAYEEAEGVAGGFVAAALSALDEKTSKSKVLLYLGEDEVQRMAKILLAQYDVLLAASNERQKQPQQVERRAKAIRLRMLVHKWRKALRVGRKRSISPCSVE